MAAHRNSFGKIIHGQEIRVGWGKVFAIYTWSIHVFINQLTEIGVFIFLLHLVGVDRQRSGEMVKKEGICEKIQVRVAKTYGLEM